MSKKQISSQVTQSVYEAPSWAGKPPPGLHLDVLKDGRMIEIFFNNIFKIAAVKHCSWDILGSIRLEKQKPQQVQLNNTLHFGASTRSYILREKPQSLSQSGEDAAQKAAEGSDEEMTAGLLGLPEEETELNNLTEFNTAHNKRIGVASVEDTAITPEIARTKRKRKLSHVSFSDEDVVINPEDIDPTVGRFRNLVQTSVIPLKKKKSESPLSVDIKDGRNRFSLYDDLPLEEKTSPTTPTSPSFSFIGSTILGLKNAPNLAPDVGMDPVPTQPIVPANVTVTTEPEPKKKKYMKEAWPGKKPTPSLLL
ncbi:putative nuclear inhibitor of protein phosphatase 1 [Apostichopus japonicus]|uniref:Putative nuclear inhibitor of protein phosphatase 1 n=1 Tax=Stichopus japonicus TaxID=307972 RepID=A0A2G8JGC9_STIJA|nr:putative nuclear inhibitor of protein phosphatase 1 [Apostichopus japonicus]